MNPQRAGRAALATLSLLISGTLAAADDPAPRATIAAPDGGRRAGAIRKDADGRFVFATADGAAVPLERAGPVTFERPEAGDLGGTPPFRVEIGLDQSLSGRLERLDEEAVRIVSGPDDRPITVRRAGALAIRPRLGEANVLLDGFESWDEARWVRLGEPRLDGDRPAVGKTALAIGGNLSSVTHTFAKPVASGRVELACDLDDSKTDDTRWFVDFCFRGPGRDLQPVRVVLGWKGGAIAVETPDGPSLAVQRLAPAPGWHRLVVRFEPESRLDLAIDGVILAHGRGPAGPLAEIRIASDPKGRPPAGLRGQVDDLKVFRTVQPTRSPENDPHQDEVRLVGGDQYFGEVRSADAAGIAMTIDGRPLRLDWSEVVGLRLRLARTPGEPIDGPITRVSWDAGDALAPDRAEGALVDADGRSLVLATPYAGLLKIPVAALLQVEAVGRARRLVIDPGRHHLGDQYQATFDPPHAEGDTLEIPFTLDAVPEGRSTVALDVIEVAGEADHLAFSREIRNNELRTYVALNGRRIDYVNRHILDLNETPRRVFLPIPDGLLRAGPNVLRIEQTSMADNPKLFDDIGVLAVAIESGPPEAPNP